MSDAASVDESGVADRCFCPHAGPCCHSDHGCCGSCCDEAEHRRLQDELDVEEFEGGYPWPNI